MKKSHAVVAVAMLLCAMLSACIGTEGNPLPTTIRSSDGRISISVPEGWAEYNAETKDNMVMALSGSGGAFAQVFWYPDVADKELTTADYVSEAALYYGDYVTGSAAKITVAGNEGYYFAYKIEISDNAAASASLLPSASESAEASPSPNVRETFQGYEYFINFTGGVVEVDIFFSFTDTAPTNDDLAALRDIAQTIRVK